MAKDSVINTYKLSEDGKYYTLEIRNVKYEGDVLIDAEDYERVSKYRWNILNNGIVAHTFVEKETRKSKAILLHDFILNVEKENDLND